MLRTAARISMYAGIRTALIDQFIGQGCMSVAAVRWFCHQDKDMDTRTIKVQIPKGYDNVHASQERLHVPRPQEVAPDFEGKAVVNGQFKDIKLADYRGKWIILFFYPLDFTFVCPTEITAFSDKADEFRKLECEVIACSCDSHFSHLAWINTPRKDGGLGEMKIPVLSDYSKTIARNYGVLLEKLGAALRGLFLIDPCGKVRHVTVNDLPVGRSVEETLRLLKAFQFTDKHGEVCPANWTPEKGGSIKPDPKGSKEYFKNVK